jgi:hypothetical protein
MQAEPYKAQAHPLVLVCASEEAIQVLCELVSAGRPISEVLDAAKRLASSRRVASPAWVVARLAHKLTMQPAVSGCVISGGTAQLTEPVESNLAISANFLAPIAGSRSLIALSGRQSLEAGLSRNVNYLGQLGPRCSGSLQRCP